MDAPSSSIPMRLQRGIDHAMSCPKGAFPTLRHNEIRDLTADLLAEVCSDVCMEPEQMRLASTTVEDGARVDIRARILGQGFWGCPQQRAFFYIKVFNPNAQTNRQHPLSSRYTFHEKAKKRMYEQRICDIEHGSFTPLVFSTTGGMGKAANIFYKRLASQIAKKTAISYSDGLDEMPLKFFAIEISNLVFKRCPLEIRICN